MTGSGLVRVIGVNGSDLTPAERQALWHLAQGLSPVQAARRLSISESTLRRTVRQARDKLGADGTINAVYIATRRGLI